MVTKHILNLIEVTITNDLVTVNSNITSMVTSLLISHDVPHVWLFVAIFKAIQAIIRGSSTLVLYKLLKTCSQMYV
jgi:hypothetical protein